MKRSAALIALTLGLAVAAPTFAATPPGELKMIASEAVQGDANAQLLYGLAYLEGRDGLTPDAAKAVFWLRRSARSGHPYAQMVLGTLYDRGKGVAKAPDRACYWWRRAAEAGNAKAQYHLGKAYLEGRGIGRDPAKALHWLTHAANQGETKAQFLIGRMYYEGYAVAQDRALARDWLDRAAAQGDSDAINLLRALRNVVDTTTMIYHQSAEVLSAKARAGDPQAQYELGLRYESGAWDVTRDEKRALMWLTRAAENGNHHAMATLAHIYGQGQLGLAPDLERAAYWQRRADTYR